MQFEQTFPGVEDPAEVAAEPAGDVLDVDLGYQIQVEVGSELVQRRGQSGRPDVGGFVLAEPVGDRRVDEIGVTR